MVQTMEDKRANTPNARKTSTTLAFRYPMARRRVLEVIAEERAIDLSDVLREATDEFIERYVREGRAA